MIKLSAINEYYYCCNSCNANTNVKKITIGLTEESTSSFRVCEKCLNELFENKLKQELAQETIKAKDAEIERLKSTFAGYENFQREKQLEQELQKTRAQLSKAEQRIFHAPHCVTNYERNDCDCGYEQYFKDKQGEG